MADTPLEMMRPVDWPVMGPDRSLKLQVVREALELISDPARWCVRASAVSALGTAVSCTSPEAVAWCVAGAVTYRLAEHGVFIGVGLLAELDELAPRVIPGGVSLTYVNDHLGRNAAVRVLRAYLETYAPRTTSMLPEDDT